jgi:hypothetical protein
MKNIIEILFLGVFLIFVSWGVFTFYNLYHTEVQEIPENELIQFRLHSTNTFGYRYDILLENIKVGHVQINMKQKRTLCKKYVCTEP